MFLSLSILWHRYAAPAILKGIMTHSMGVSVLSPAGWHCWIQETPRRLVKSEQSTASLPMRSVQLSFDHAILEASKLPLHIC